MSAKFKWGLLSTARINGVILRGMQHSERGEVYGVASRDPARAQAYAEARGLPRAYGSYPRVLGKYVRQDSLFRIEEAVRKMTSAVAARLKIRERGLLREGMFADVVVFDPNTIIDRATFERPHQLSVGVQYVFVNGIAVLAAGRHTGATPGRVVRGEFASHGSRRR